MRDLAKSALTFPWALSMFGVQQLVSLVVPPAGGRVAVATDAIDAVTRAAERQFDGWLDQALDIGSAVQRTLVDLTMFRPPSIDSSGLMRLAADRRLAPVVQATAQYGLAPIAWLDSYRIAAEDSPAALQEFSNKLRVLQFATEMHSDLGLETADETPLTELLDRAAALETFPRLWAIETLGAYYAERALKHSGGADPQELLSDESLDQIPPWNWPMLHAGIGKAFAEFVLEPLCPTSSSDLVRHAITRFVGLCRRSSRRGYQGAALESLGLVARSLYQNVVPRLDRELEAIEPDLQGYFWHGAGRAMYFDPNNMLPSSNAPSRTIAALRQETPHYLGYQNALSGIAWETTLVNMQYPEVMELVLRHHGELAETDSAFADGVSSAVVVRALATPDDRSVGPFVAHEPRRGAAAEAWRTHVTTPCQAALGRTYGDLPPNAVIGELFHYRTGSA